MKFQSMIRMQQMMLVGLGAALLLANSVYAQQEIDPTYFEVTPGTPQAHQDAAQSPESSNAASAVAAVPSAIDMERAADQEASLVEWTAVDTLAMLATILCLGSIVAYGIAETQRKRGSQIPA